MSESLREKVIKALLDSPVNLRFTDLYNETGRPSKSHFSQELHLLQNEGLVDREQIDYKHVEYSLNREAYKRWLDEEQKKLDEKMRKAEKKL